MPTQRVAAPPHVDLNESYVRESSVATVNLENERKFSSIHKAGQAAQEQEISPQKNILDMSNANDTTSVKQDTVRGEERSPEKQEEVWQGLNQPMPTLPPQ